jgi:hypothetical protein
MLLEVLFIFAGLVTGIITGLVGASAIVAFIPLVLIFYDYNAFTLIGMSLVLDIFVALPALFNYIKYKNVHFKAGFYFVLPAIFGAVIGSYFSAKIPDTHLTGITALFIAFAGATIFMRKSSEKKTGTFMKDLSSRDFKFWIGIFACFVIGFLGGSLGAAGGISILFLFVFIFGYETHEAIGTSIFIMFFIAVFGAATHFYYIDRMQFSWLLLTLSVAGGFFGALLSSRIANRFSEKILNRAVGSILFILGIVTFVHKILL